MTGRGVRAAAALITLAVALGIVPDGAGAVATTAPSRLLPAAIAADFDPGNIIADTVFFDPGTMTVDQVQQFLNARGTNCTPGTPACLKDVRAVTVAKAADGLCRGYTGGLSQSAAEIIVGVAQSCDVNPRVLIVLLEKEQSLITRTRPTTYAYERATGFGCPDTAPCNAEYFGLFNQVYLAARQFQNYAANPDRYPRYRPGRLNTVLYHPNAACSSSSIYIQNQATAGLYTYTPYQPNSAALANLYGTGDSCSSYGNRNFWRLFTDWFGSTEGGGFLVRTTDNPTVYLISGSTKYPIPTMAMLAVYSPLGPVGYVSQLYLDRRTTGPSLNRFAVGPDGSVYLVDNGRRYWVGSCTMVADFGGSCGSLISLTEVQVSALTDGSALTRSLTTSSGHTYYVSGGERREAADAQSLVDAGLAAPGVMLNDTAVAQLTVGDPIIRPGLLLRNRQTGQWVLSSTEGTNPVPSAFVTSSAMGLLTQRSLDDVSLARLPLGATVGPFVRSATDTVFLVRGTSLSELTDASLAPATTAVIGDEVLARFTPTGTVGSPLFVQPVGASLRYQVRAGVLHPARDDAELVALGGTPSSVLAIRPDLSNLLTVGRDAALTQFDDVRITDLFATEIVWLVDRGITNGNGPGTFGPAAPTRRDAMAAFLYRFAGSPAFTPPTTATFTDVPTDYLFYKEIEWLASTGITRGTSPTTFSPTEPVQRQAMAAFLYRLDHL